MRPTFPKTHPVLTFVSGSSASNHRAKELFCSLFSFQEIVPPLSSFPESESNNINTSKDALTQSTSLGMVSGPSIQSKAIQCSNSGTILHFLSLESKSPFWKQSTLMEDNYPLSLVAITNGNDPSNSETQDSNEDHVWESIQKARDYISQHVDTSSSLKLNLWYNTVLSKQSRPFHSMDLVGSSYALPLIQTPPLPKTISTPNPIHNNDTNTQDYSLREVVIPYIDQDEVNPSHSLLSSKLNIQNFPRPKDPISQKPVIGLFQWPQEASATPSTSTSTSPLYLRPLPAAEEDRVLPSPSLVFQCPALDSTQHHLKQSCPEVLLAKVGFTAHSHSKSQKHNGQYMVRHDSFMGLDIRICEAQHLSSSFAEAQEALLAGSLEDLQNRNVLSEGKMDGKVEVVHVTNTTATNDAKVNGNHSQSAVDDPMHNSGDCWVEFRANMKSPSGFFKGSGHTIASSNLGKKKSPKIATAPNLPYE